VKEVGEEEAGQGCAQTVARDPQGGVGAFLDELVANRSVDLPDEELVEGERWTKGVVRILAPVLPEAPRDLHRVAHKAFSHLYGTNSRHRNW
jgi:hypothetical protein